MDIGLEFPKGILRPELLMGTIHTVGAYSVLVNLTDAGAPSGSYYQGGRYGKGEVGEFVVIEGQVNLVLGRVIEVKKDDLSKIKNDALGKIQLLGSISMETLQVSPGVDSYPRLGDRVYAAPHKLVAKIPELMDIDKVNPVTISIGYVDLVQESQVMVKPEKLFGRHLAILGSTGGGKSWTTAKIIEECLRFNSKLILLDATGEYRNLKSNSIEHVHLSEPVNPAENSKPCKLSPESFQESDFLALFEPSGKVQGPKFKEAIKSLRIAKLAPDLFPEGYILKIEQSKDNFKKAISRTELFNNIDNPRIPFDVLEIAKQIEQECV